MGLSGRDIELKQFSVAGLGWISFTAKSLSFSGKMLPPDTHLTISYGNESKTADAHLTRQLLRGQKLHATICRVHHSDIQKLSGFVRSRLENLLVRHLTLVDPEQLSHGKYVFIAWHDDIAERDAALIDPVKTTAQQAVTRRGKGRFRLSTDDDTVSKIRECFSSGVLPEELTRWLAQNAYDPQVLQTEMKGAQGILVGNGELSMVISVPFEDGSVSTFRLDSSSVDRIQEDVLTCVTQSELGRSLLTQYHICLDCLQRASRQADVNSRAPILIGCFEQRRSE
ncbi:MAG: hypothetical protein ACLFPU_10005 [Dehalococcoidia bacterium]